MSKEKQNAEIYRHMNEELFNNIEKQYQELAKVNAIEKMAEDIPQKIVAYNGDPKGHHLYMEQRFEIAEALYNADYRKQEWISVDERLPDKEGTYLVYTDQDNITMDIFCIYPSHGTKFWSGGFRGKVTHWMPLPEAPKMKGAEE